MIMFFFFFFLDTKLVPLSLGVDILRSWATNSSCSTENNRKFLNEGAVELGRELAKELRDWLQACTSTSPSCRRRHDSHMYAAAPCGEARTSSYRSLEHRSPTQTPAHLYIQLGHTSYPIQGNPSFGSSSHCFFLMEKGRPHP